MQAKLALRNIRRSFKDYGIYFVTLLFGVAMFYAFNSVQHQSILFDLEGTASSTVFKTTGIFLSMFSVIIAFVLGFLVVYANRFLIKRRKHEFGIYLMLGMKPSHVSQIVLFETLIVGGVSLVAGLVLGIALSQGLSFFTAGLFSIPMDQYRFLFSEEAFFLTLACFALIFVVVAVFNTVSVRRYKLIDLLSARSKNERFRVRSPWMSLAVFVVAVGLIAAAYALLVESGLVAFDDKFWAATGLMLVGTLLFFWSLAGFVIAVVQRTRGVYFRRLSMFTLRQIASKVNTAFLSLWLVCVMLFFSMTVFSTGMGLVKVFTGNLEEGTLYDASISAYVYLVADTDVVPGNVNAEDATQAAERMESNQKKLDEAASWDWDMAERIKSGMTTWDDFVAGYAQADFYQPAEGTETYGELMERLGFTPDTTAMTSLQNQHVAIISQSQFNAHRLLTGREPIDVGESGYAVNNVVDLSLPLSKLMAQSGTTIQVGGKSLQATGELVGQAFSSSSFLSDGSELVVPDSVIEDLRAAGVVPYTSYLNIDYKVDRVQGDKMLKEGLAQSLPPDEKAIANYAWFTTSAWPATILYTADEVLSQATSMQMMITYLALYIGFVFLITTAAVLAIQQLSEASDSLPRYRLLAQLGCDRRMVLGSLRTQVVIYFLAPLGLAICHTICATSVLGQTLFIHLGVSATEPILMTAALVVIVYGSYLLVTYFASRSIIKGALGKKLLG